MTDENPNEPSHTRKTPFSDFEGYTNQEPKSPLRTKTISYALFESPNMVDVSSSPLSRGVIRSLCISDSHDDDLKRDNWQKQKESIPCVRNRLILQSDNPAFSCGMPTEIPRTKLPAFRSRSMHDLVEIFYPSPPSHPDTSPSQSPEFCEEKLFRSLDTDDTAPDSSSAPHLPLVPNKQHPELKTISVHSMNEILENKLAHIHQRFVFVDCRYPYEYSAGCIRDAINIPATDMAHTALFDGVKSLNQDTAIVFYCEFSSERGPRMYRHVRTIDRGLNSTAYPALYYPHMYLMAGGYSEFYRCYKFRCVPPLYVKMHDPQYQQELLHWRRERRLSKRTRSHQDNLRMTITQPTSLWLRLGQPITGPIDDVEKRHATESGSVNENKDEDEEKDPGQSTQRAPTQSCSP